MNAQKHTKQIVIIGDGYSDYVGLKQFVSAIFESLPANDELKFFDYNVLESLNIGHFVNQFIDKADKTSGYDLFGESATHFK